MEHLVAVVRAKLKLPTHWVSNSTKIFPRASLRKVKAAIEAAMSAGSPTLITHSLNPDLLPLKTRAGRPLIHNVLVGPLQPGAGSHCLVQIVDVTLAVERERVLRKRQNTRYDAVVDSAPDVIMTLDANGDVQLRKSRGRAPIRIYLSGADRKAG